MLNDQESDKIDQESDKIDQESDKIDQESDKIAKPRFKRQISMSNEFLRKGIHLGSLTIPVAYAYLTKSAALWILIPLTIISLFIDIGRHRIPALGQFIGKTFGKILRPHERETKRFFLSGATYVLISATFCVLVFPKLITITAFAILIVSDATSALVGRAFGKHRFLDKSLEGTLGFIASAWIVILLTPKAGPVAAEYYLAAFAAVVGGIFEAASVTLHVDDNFAVPASIGGTMWLIYYLLDKFNPTEYHELYMKLLHTM